MATTDVFKVVFSEDGTVTALGRLVSRGGSGSATGVDGEGNWVQQADLSTITCAVYDLNAAAPSTAVVSPTVTISSVVLDTPVTTNVIWTVDTTGYNFIHDLPITAFPTGGHTYLVEYKFTFTDSTVAWARYKGKAVPVLTS